MRISHIVVDIMDPPCVNVRTTKKSQCTRNRNRNRNRNVLHDEEHAKMGFPRKPTTVL